MDYMSVNLFETCYLLSYWISTHASAIVSSISLVSRRRLTLLNLISVDRR